MDPATSRPSIVFDYMSPHTTMRGEPAVTPGGCSIEVSTSAYGAIQALATQHDGRLPQWTRPVLARIDDGERHATDLAVLVRALNRRDVYVRGLHRASVEVIRPEPP